LLIRLPPNSILFDCALYKRYSPNFGYGSSYFPLKYWLLPTKDLDDWSEFYFFALFLVTRAIILVVNCMDIRLTIPTSDRSYNLMIFLGFIIEKILNPKFVPIAKHELSWLKTEVTTVSSDMNYGGKTKTSSHLFCDGLTFLLNSNFLLLRFLVEIGMVLSYNEELLEWETFFSLLLANLSFCYSKSYLSIWFTFVEILI
jgi:hypothetical protein